MSGQLKKVELENQGRLELPKKVSGWLGVGSTKEPKRTLRLVHKEGRVAVFYASDEEMATGIGSVLWCPVENVSNDWLDCVEQWGGK